MKKYIAIESACQHCGFPLKARRKTETSYRFWFFIARLDDLEYIHEATGKRVCPPHTKASPFSDWHATRAYRKAVQYQSKEEVTR